MPPQKAKKAQELEGVEAWFGKKFVNQIASKVLKKHGLPKGTKPWRTGTYSSVYMLGDNKLLRLSSVPLEKYAHPDRFIRMGETIRKRAGDLMPKCYEEVHHEIAEKNLTYGYITESVVEKVLALDIASWRMVFATPNLLFKAVIDAGQELFSRKVVHRDISDGNMLLNANTLKFQFIDSDDACIYPNGMMCTIGNVENGFGTEGFAMPTIHGVGLSAHKSLFYTLTNLPVRDSDWIIADETAYKKNPTLELVHNMVHALCIVAFQAISGAQTGRSFIRNKKYWIDLPEDWKAFLAAVCTPLATDRMDFDACQKALAKLSPLVWAPGKTGVAIRREVLSRRASPLLGWSKPTPRRPSSPTIMNPKSGRMVLMGNRVHKKLCVEQEVPKQFCTEF